MWCGNAFHSVGAATLKDLSANVFLFVAGITSKSAAYFADLSPDLDGTCCVRRDLRYSGPHCF